MKTCHQKAPRLAGWAEENIPEGLTAFMLPLYHRTRMRMTNGLERLNKEIKHRTRVATPWCPKTQTRCGTTTYRTFSCQGIHFPHYGIFGRPSSPCGTLG